MPVTTGSIRRRFSAPLQSSLDGDNKPAASNGPETEAGPDHSAGRGASQEPAWTLPERIPLPPAADLGAVSDGTRQGNEEPVSPPERTTPERQKNAASDDGLQISKPAAQSPNRLPKPPVGPGEPMNAAKAAQRPTVQAKKTQPPPERAKVAAEIPNAAPSHGSAIAAADPQPAPQANAARPEDLNAARGKRQRLSDQDAKDHDTHARGWVAGLSEANQLPARKPAPNRQSAEQPSPAALREQPTQTTAAKAEPARAAPAKAERPADQAPPAAAADTTQAAERAQDPRPQRDREASPERNKPAGIAPTKTEEPKPTPAAKLPPKGTQVAALPAQRANKATTQPDQKPGAKPVAAAIIPDAPPLPQRNPRIAALPAAQQTPTVRRRQPERSQPPRSRRQQAEVKRSPPSRSRRQTRSRPRPTPKKKAAPAGRRKWVRDALGLDASLLGGPKLRGPAIPPWVTTVVPGAPDPTHAGPRLHKPTAPQPLQSEPRARDLAQNRCSFGQVCETPQFD